MHLLFLSFSSQVFRYCDLLTTALNDAQILFQEQEETWQHWHVE